MPLSRRSPPAAARDTSPLGRFSCRLFTAAACLPLAVGCASSPPPSLPIAAVSILDDRELEVKALLLLLADRRTYEGFTVDRALDGDRGTRRWLATSLGRVGDPRGELVLRELLTGGDPEVRRAAAFALGELGEVVRIDAEPLFRACLDPDRQVGILAVEALAKRDTDLQEVVTRLIELSPEELFARLLPSLYRFRGAGVVRWAEQGLELEPPLRASAALALAGAPRPEARPALRGLLADPSPWVQSLAARALGRIGDGSDLGRLESLLDGAEAPPVIEALRAAARLIDRGEAAPPEPWRGALLRLIEDPRPSVGLVALEVSSRWLLDEELGAALVRASGSELRRRREVALISLARGGDPRAEGLVVDATGSHDPVMRAVAAGAARHLASGLAVAERLARDPDPAPRTAALDTLITLDPDGAGARVEAALQDADLAVRSLALEWLGEHPKLPFEKLLPVFAAARLDATPAVRLSAVRALTARALAEALERGSIVAALEELAREREYVVRREAISGLAALGRPLPPLGGVADRPTVAAYREIVQRTARERTVVVVTERGDLRLQLACPQAPQTCLSFLQLAAQGFYDGLTFHRVVPGFIVQGGDPRGDGRGGPGYTLRDEINRLRYRRGVVGMAHSGRDTAGSQFFITLTPQPRLDGLYTAFGVVIEGGEVLDRLVQGDRILTIHEAAD